MRKQIFNITSPWFLLVMGFLLSASALFKSVSVFYRNLTTIGTSSQWKFVASLASFVIFLWMFLLLFGATVFLFLKKTILKNKE